MSTETKTKDPTLADVFAPYRDKLAEYVAAAARDDANADDFFRQAQDIAKAFWAGVEYGRGHRA